VSLGGQGGPGFNGVPNTGSGGAGGASYGGPGGSGSSGRCIIVLNDTSLSSSSPISTISGLNPIQSSFNTFQGYVNFYNPTTGGISIGNITNVRGIFSVSTIYAINLGGVDNSGPSFATQILWQSTVENIWTPPVGITAVRFTVIGGGGSGVAATGAAPFWKSSGGGGGATSIIVQNIFTQTPFVLRAGTGGAAVTSVNTNTSGNPGISSFIRIGNNSSFVLALGGRGGINTSALTYAAGGDGSQGIGTITMSGGAGGAPAIWPSVTPSAGSGGNSYFGGGAAGPIEPNTGVAGRYGGGGSGAHNQGGGTITSGAGGNGLILIEY
jgi:hypothetical protein